MDHGVLPLDDPPLLTQQHDVQIFVIRRQPADGRQIQDE
jgi:hypothetical protein